MSQATHPAAKSTPLPRPEDVFGMNPREARTIRLLSSLDAAGVDLPEQVQTAREVHARLWSRLAEVRDDTARYGSPLYNPNPGTYQEPGVFLLAWTARAAAVERLSAAVTAGADPDVVTQILEEGQASIAAARARAEAAVDAQAVITDALTSVGGEGPGGLEDVVRDSADAVFAAMNDRLQDLLADVRDLASHLPQPISAAATIDAAPQAQQAYRTIRDEHVPAYDALRVAQLALATVVAGDAEFVDRAWHTPAARLRDIDTLWPGWAGPTNIPIADGLLSTQLYAVPAPWPENPTDRLVWEARTGAGWVPTPAQLTKAYDAAHAARTQRAHLAAMQVPIDPAPVGSLA